MADSFSRYDVYAVVGSHYCYRDTGVLKNRFGIRLIFLQSARTIYWSVPLLVAFHLIIFVPSTAICLAIFTLLRGNFDMRIL